jgi:hypothetical protein
MKQKPSVVRNIAKRISGVTMPIGRKRMRWLRNWPCLCGSENKYKNCCMKDIESLTSSDGNVTTKSLPKEIQETVDALRKAAEKKGSCKNG